MNLASPREPDRIAREFDGNHSVDPIIRQPANVHDLILAIDSLAPALIAILVSNAPVLNALRCHPAGVQRMQFSSEAVRARHKKVVRIAPKREPQNLLLAPLERSLPRIWRHMKKPIQRMLLRGRLTAALNVFVDVQRERSDRLRKQSRAGQNNRALHRGFAVDANTGWIARRERRRLIPAHAAVFAFGEPQDSALRNHRISIPGSGSSGFGFWLAE